jgi:hypothetical protein
MADFSIPITVPDGKVADLVSALKDYYGTKEDGSDYSTAELKDLFAADVRRRLGVHYKDWLKKQAADPDLGAT